MGSWSARNYYISSVYVELKLGHDGYVMERQLISFTA